MLPTNRAKAKLASGETVFGCFVRFGAPGLAELLALQGFDFLVLDAEHGGLDPDDCEDLVRAAQLRGAAPIVRVPANDRSTILRYMDIGAAGIHVPMIESAEAAVRAKRSVKYHPEGERGLGGVRAANYAQLEPLGEYVLHANRETMVVAQIETPAGHRAPARDHRQRRGRRRLHRPPGPLARARASGRDRPSRGADGDRPDRHPGRALASRARHHGRRRRGRQALARPRRALHQRDLRDHGARRLPRLPGRGVGQAHGGRVVSALRLWCERALPRDLLPLLGEGVELLPSASESPEDPWRAIGAADAVIASSRLRYDRAMMERAPRLRVIARTGIGVDNVEIGEATRRGIAVCNTPDAPSQSTAEHAIAMLLALAKGLRPAHQALARGERRDFFATHRGIELKGRTLGLIGLGRIGALVAGLAKALGMRALAYDPFIDAARCAALGAEHAPTLDAALAASDAVSLHMPLTDATRGIIGAAQLALMRPGALLINCARGGLVDEAALLAALQSGRLGGAALDVFASEPPPADHPLLLRDDVIATPHVAPATVEGRARLWRDAIANALAVLAGRRPAHLVNRELAQPLAAIQGQP